MPDLGEIDFGRAVWAFALSLALWLVVQAELNPDRSDIFELAVEARNVPSGLVVTNEADWRPVQVRLSAPRDVFAQLRASQLRAYVDLSRAGPGQAPFPVEVPPPDPQVRVGEPTPARIVVRLEELTRKTVPVRPRQEGNPPFGYRPGRPTVNPDTLVVTGPTSFVRRIEAAEVDIRLEGVTTDVDTTLPPSLLNAQGERVPPTAPGVDVQPAAVQVQLPISQQISYKDVGVHPLLRGAVPPGYWVQSVSIDPAVVTVIGEPRLLGTVEVLDTEPVDLTAATSAFTRPVVLQVPQGLALARTEPLTLSVQVVPLTLRQSLRVPVRIVNVGAELFVASEVPIVEVAANGPADRGLSVAEVQATADAAGLGPGAHILAVSVRLPERYQLEDVRPPTVGVVLREASAPVPAAPPPPPTATPAPTAEPVELAPPEPTPLPSPRPIELTPIPAATPTVPTPSPTASPTATRTPATPTLPATARPAER